MDYSNRNTQSPAPTIGGPAHQPSMASANGGHNKKGKRGRVGKYDVSRILTLVLVAAVAILIIAVAIVVATGSVKSEDKYVDTSKLQAVFLNTGQVYFGNITSLNNKYFVLTNIYYLQSSNNGSSNNSSNSNNNVTLVKLGCELHEPYDQMVINSDQVTFWENLQDNGQVAKAVSTFQKQNPNGQKCADQSSSASSNSANSTQNANSSNSNSSTSGNSNP
jgi:hypothetical protein